MTRIIELGWLFFFGEMNKLEYLHEDSLSTLRMFIFFHRAGEVQQLISARK